MSNVELKYIINFNIDNKFLMINSIPVFIGYDHRERAATNVLIDSIYQLSSIPVSITPIVTKQLEASGFHSRKRDSKQSTSFSFTRFLVPFLMGYKGWAIFMDCDVLCRYDIKNLWDLKDDKYAIMCIHHNHNPREDTKFLGEKQSSYPKKNWSSVMLMNCSRCKALTPDYVNNASGLDLHRFNWLESEDLVGEIDESWNYLVQVQSKEKSRKAKLLHWTLGGPWFSDQRIKNDPLTEEWLVARESAFKLWN